MTRSTLLLAITTILGITTLLFVIFGLLYNLILMVLAIPFAIATVFLWYHASGRLLDHLTVNHIPPPRDEPRTNQDSHRTPPPADRGPDMTIATARAILGVDENATHDDIRSAYRNRVIHVHPDSETGNKEAFKCLRTAYERLTTNTPP